MSDKEKIFRTIQPKADNVESMQQKYQVLLYALFFPASSLRACFHDPEFTSISYFVSGECQISAKIRFLAKVKALFWILYHGLQQWLVNDQGGHE